MRIRGTGAALPPRVVSNAELVQNGLDVTDEWIVKRTGVRTRRIAEAGVTCSDLGCEAARQALEMADMRPAQLDMIIMATVTPDTCCPSAANWLQAKLGASRAVTFDITAACSGFVFALNIAGQYLQTGACRTILVVASEIMSRTLDWTDRSSCILWGDGAGAAVLTRDDGGPQVLSTHICTDGASGHYLQLPGGGSLTSPISHESVDRGRHRLKMIDASLSFRVAVRRFMECIVQAADHNQVAVDAIDWFIPHQANLRIFQNIAQSMHIPIEKFYLNLQKHGNLSAASCAVALDEAVRDGSIREGQMICMPVFGGGLAWGSAMIRW